MSNKVYVWWRLNFFKGLSKGLIPSNAIGVDFYIKKTELHKKGGTTCTINTILTYLRPLTENHRLIRQPGTLHLHADLDRPPNISGRMSDHISRWWQGLGEHYCTMDSVKRNLDHSQTEQEVEHLPPCLLTFDLVVFFWPISVKKIRVMFPGKQQPRVCFWTHSLVKSENSKIILFDYI